MNLENRTILITGGGSGIGLALARALNNHGNTVILCGRNGARLDAVVKDNPGFFSYTCDVSDSASVVDLAKIVADKHPKLDMLINNAGANHPGDLCTPEGLSSLEKMFRTNTLGPILLTTHLLPILRGNADPTVVNVTSGLAYMPIAAMAGYCATKAASHALTLCLGPQLQGVRVVEILPPTTDTDMTRDFQTKKMSPDEVARRAVAGLAVGRTEIPIGESAQLRTFARMAPGFAFKTLNKAP